MSKLVSACLALALVLGFGLVSVPSAQAEEYKCVYIAKTKRGLGQKIPGTRGVHEVRYRDHAPRKIKVRKRLRACSRAASKCRAKLAGRKISGKNRRARCVVLRIKRD